MAHLLRLIVAALLLAVSVSAAASVPMVRSWYAYADVYKVTGPESSQAAACAAGAAWAQANTINKGGTVWDSPTCHILNNDGGRSGSTLGIGWEGDSACPANSTPSGGACTCNTGYAEQGGACVAPNTGTDHQKECYAFSGVQTVSGGILVSDIALTGNVSDGTNLCYPTGSGNKGCTVTFSNTATASYSDGSKVSYGRYSMTDTGKKYGANNLPDYTCTAGAENTPTENKTSDGTKCNGYVGTVNGVESCIKGTDAATGVDITGKTTTTTDSSGNKTQSKTETKCTGNSCTTTTTTTTTNSSGSTTSGTTTSTTQGKGEFCAANSSAAVCSGTGSGDGDGEDDGVGSVGSVTDGKDHEQPGLYETQYPRGLAGIWEDSGIAGADGKFGGLVAALSPSLVDTNGACISFRIPLDLGIVSFGVVDVSPPCLIWPFIRICVLITALWLCRALIFGG